MTVFADASALVKRYVHEPGSVEVDAVGPVVASALSLVEVPSALWRKQREGAMEVDDAAVLTDQFLTDVHDPARIVGLVALHDEVLASATGLVARHGLRSGDAIQLACALAGPDLPLLAYDDRLRDAAAREGLRLLP